MTDENIAYGKNPVLWSSRMIGRRDFFSDGSIRTCMGMSVVATISPRISNPRQKISGAWILNFVRNGSPIRKSTERSETLPDIFEATMRYSFPRPSFSRVHFRNELVVPEENAPDPTDIQSAPRVNVQKLSATR